MNLTKIGINSLNRVMQKKGASIFVVLHHPIEKSVEDNYLLEIIFILDMKMLEYFLSLLKLYIEKFCFAFYKWNQYSLFSYVIKPDDRLL